MAARKQTTPEEALRDLLNPADVPATPPAETPAAPPAPASAPPPAPPPATIPVRGFRTVNAGFIPRDGFLCDVAAGTLVADDDAARYRALGFELEPVAALTRTETFDGRPVVAT
jgi:hypothetical protein